MYYFATYSQPFDNQPGQDYGRFCIRSLDGKGQGKTHLVLVATMSRADKQAVESFHIKGGLMPPEYRTSTFYNTDEKTYDSWVLETREQWRDTIGIEGHCFQILPVYVKTDKGTTRGEFFAHRDANVIGSLGCIVFTADRFIVLRDYMRKLRALGVKQLPLFVTYA